MRKIGSGRGMVSAYPRQLESLIRLAEAHAKVRFSDKVETIDVEEAKRLHREALKQSATDPRTGFVDISILTTGTLCSSVYALKLTVYQRLQTWSSGTPCSARVRCFPAPTHLIQMNRSLSNYAEAC